jgi:hypothetical protein
MIKIRYSSLLTILVLYALAIPTFENTFGSIGAIIVNGVLGIILFIISIYKQNEFISIVNTNFPLKIVILALLMLEVLIAFSMFYGAIFAGVNLIVRDFFELHKPILFLLTVVFSFYIFNQNHFSVAKLLLRAFIVISILAVMQLLEFDQISGLYTGWNVIGVRRLTIPFGNPYDLAFVLVFFIFYFLMYAIYNNSIRYLFLAAFALYLLICTGSRSVSLSFIIVFLLVYPIFVLRLNLKRKVKSMVLFLFVSSIGLFLINLESFIKEYPFISGQYVQFVESGDIGQSASERLDQFYFALDKSSESFLTPLIGNGPSKMEMEHVESAYTYIYYRYGIIGFILYIFVYIYILISLFKLIFRRYSQFPKDQPIFTALFLWFLTMPISAIGGMFIEQPKVSFFYYLMIGFTLARRCKFN